MQKFKSRDKTYHNVQKSKRFTLVFSNRYNAEFPSCLDLKKIKDNAHMGDVLTYVALGILGQSTRTHWKLPYVLMHVWSFVQLFCLVAHSSISVERYQQSEIQAWHFKIQAYKSELYKN